MLGIKVDLFAVKSLIEEIIKSEIERNFREGGRFGSGKFSGGTEKWLPSKRAKKQHGQTLVDTGRLKDSIQVNANIGGDGSGRIEISTNLKYAAIHQFGGIIHIPSYSRLTEQKRFERGPKKGQFRKLKPSERERIGRGSTIPAYDISMPARPFITLPDEIEQDIAKEIEKYLQVEGDENIVLEVL